MKTLALRARVFIHCFLVFGYPGETLALVVHILHQGSDPKDAKKGHNEGEGPGGSIRGIHALSENSEIFWNHWSHGPILSLPLGLIVLKSAMSLSVISVISRCLLKLQPTTILTVFTS